jgi:hypothetical protein
MATVLVRALSGDPANDPQQAAGMRRKSATVTTSFAVGSAKNGTAKYVAQCSCVKQTPIKATDNPYHQRYFPDVLILISGRGKLKKRASAC